LYIFPAGFCASMYWCIHATRRDQRLSGSRLFDLKNCLYL
jgi:hypothetical protein